MIQIPTTDEIREMFRSEVVGLIDEIKSDLVRPAPELMTKKEVADYLRCDVSKITRYMTKGLPFEKFGDHPRFRKASIDLWLKGEI